MSQKTLLFDNSVFLVYIVITCLLVLFLTTCITRAEQNVRIGIYQNSPKISLSETGHPEGIYIDLIEAIAAEEGWSIDYVPGTWAQCLDCLNAGKIDLMPDVALTPERKHLYTFHNEPVLSDWFQVYARHGSGIRTILDLNGRRVSVLERSIQQEVFSNQVICFDLKVNLVTFPDYSSAFTSAIRGDSDAVISNRFYGATHRTSQLEDTAIIFNPTQLYFAAPKRANYILLDAIDRHLKRMKKDPASLYYRSLQRWTSEKVNFVFPMWIKFTGIVIAVILILSFFWSVSLRRQIKIRTGELNIRNREIDELYRELQKHAETLEKRVAERTDELERMNSDLLRAKDAAESADHLKSAFLATMSHELRTPLNSIIGFTGILLMGLVGPLNEEQKKQLVMVQDSARHLLELINDVLDISRIEAGQFQLACEHFDMKSAIEKSLEKITTLAEKKGLTVTSVIAPSVGDVYGDRRRVEQILINLLSNAVKFTDCGEVRIESRTEKGLLVTQVTDTGIGIRPEDMGSLFKPFRQIDTGISRQYEGTGLGLSICKKLVEAMGGRIYVESEAGRGSVFTFIMPLEKKVAK
ncbi:MAG: ATP-binding protein [Candidatus Eremiobacterota bacterium]